MRPIPMLVLATICSILLLQMAPNPASAEGNTYLIKLKNGGEIICDKMSFEGDTLFYKFSSYGRKKVGISKNAVKGIFVRKQGQGDDPPEWGQKDILPQVLDPSHGPWQ